MAKRSAAAANAAFVAETALLDAASPVPAKVTFYDGAVPATVATAITSQNVLAVVPMGDPAYGAPSSGVGTAAGLPLSDPSADDTGTPTFARIADGNGVDVFQLTVGDTTSGAELQLLDADITAGQPVTITALTHTCPLQ
jgi:hypothetical protein